MSEKAYSIHNGAQSVMWTRSHCKSKIMDDLIFEPKWERALLEKYDIETLGGYNGHIVYVAWFLKSNNLYQVNLGMT